MSDVIRTTPGKIQVLIRRRAKASEKAVRRAALAAAHRGKTMIGNHTPGDLGQLALSWDVKTPKEKGRELAELINDAPHAGIVEGGARPHKVSPEGWWSIYEWVERRLSEVATGELDPYGHDSGISGVTWAIVKKLGRVGQKPTHFVLDKLPTFFQITVAEINRELAKLAAKGTL